jgi:5-methylcytosine-specific restriction endonuclease McrA
MSVMDCVANPNNWQPIEGIAKQKRAGPGTKLSKKRADHRNAILKDWGERHEPQIEPKVPIDYISPFDKNKCAYCLSETIGPSGDEFRPSSQRGRMNIINCIPCCGRCNSSKQDKCGSVLIAWIKEENPKKRTQIKVEQQEKIINWYEENEKYLLIPLDTFDYIKKQTYGERLNELDTELNKWYEEFS